MMEVDHEDNGSDIEAQRSSPLLMNGELGNSSLIMRKSAIIFQSTYKFIEAGAKIASLSRVSSSSSSSTTTFYTPLPSFKHGNAEGGGGEIQVVEIVADDNTVQSNNEIELQPHDQISEEIVKEKKLDWSDTHDVDKGIHVADNSDRYMLNFTGYAQCMIRQLICKEPTILLLAIAAILSFIFGIKEEGVQNGWFEGALLVVIIFVIVSFKLARNWYKRHIWNKQNENRARKDQPFISETDSSFCADFDKLNNYIHISGLSIGILITVVLFIRFKLGYKDDENGYRLETKEEPTEIARIMNAVKKVLTESKGAVRVMITSLGITLVGITEGVPFLISIARAYWYPIFDVKMEPVNTICIEKVPWLKELKVTQFLLDKKDVTKIPPHVYSVLSDGIGVSPLTSQTTYHRVEEAICCWAEKNTGMQRDTLDKQFTIVKNNDDEMNPFEGPCKVVIEKNGDNGKEYYSYFKGPTDSILPMCSSYYDMTGQVQDLDDETKSDIVQTNNKNMNVVAFAFKHTQDVVELDENGLTFIGMFVLEYTFNLDNMRQAIAILKEGGVKMIFASEEDVEVLRTIVDETGLLNSHEALVVRGEDATKENVDKMCIMGNSSPACMLLLIEQLKKRGEVVAVVGEQASESNVVLEAAHFGLPVVTNWPETITYVINSIKGGRIVCEYMRQFIQVEIIFAISSLLINFILVILDGDDPLTVIQLVWVNLLLKFIGGPALLITQQATRQLRDELSIRPRKQPITKGMLRNILLQVSYQTGIFVFLQHRGSAILGITPKVNRSIVFNGFALCQLFNIFSARDLEQRNYFKGLGQNYLFWALSGLYLVLQFGFIELEAFLFSNTARLNWKQWAESILIGVVTWLLDVIVKWGSQYIKIDTYCDCGVLHLARNWLQYWFMRINCCYCGPRSTPNPTLASLDSSRSTSGKGWITNITRRVKPTKHRANTLMD
ncbi:calcium-transporting ATPase 12, plasma membrane-type-like [Solanum verrucosum]|uniref:calcium-transporting ATPase 12, plasma membrane-type-like n=1 Tax=Solanum verrucosum TaxID=315347 RepID=UPI0020D1CE48|nr:calcium-transporting ATPase 12, plasma membrane-type-like [Solanum verrucosum]